MRHPPLTHPHHRRRTELVEGPDIDPLEVALKPVGRKPKVGGIRELRLGIAIRVVALAKHRFRAEHGHPLTLKAI